ncbi:MAG: hypothetical protein EOM29_09790 [Bacteroidia bacterium]|nr:hypothetical protein [Bacteroidia bacterium]
MAINTRVYIEEFLKIRNKRAEIIPFNLNAPQRRLYDALAAQRRAGKPMRAIVLKARQEGISTLTEAMIFKRAVTSKNHKAAIVAHTEQSTKSLFEMSKLYYEELPEELKPETKASNAYELAFDSKTVTGLRSSIVCFTAGGRGIGRGDTIHSLHCSEYAFWPEGKKDIFAGLIQAVPPNMETMVVIESTANGFDDFKDKWDSAVAGESDFVAVFFAWFDLDEYRMPTENDFELMGAGRYGNEVELKNIFDLDDEQLRWRRWCIDNNCSGDLSLFKQEYPATPEEAFIATGDPVFDNAKVMTQLARVRNLEPEARGYFNYKKRYESVDHAIISDIEWIDDPYGYITLYERPLLRSKGILTSKCPYVIGGDTAGLGSDYFTGYCINNHTKQNAAVILKQRWNDDLYADQIYCLGMYYNTALIGVETNFSITPMRELEKLKYPRLYLRDRFDNLTSKYTKALGWETTSKTRPVMIDNLVRWVRESTELFLDSRLLREMLTFIKNPTSGKKEAQEGKHDDLVIAAAVAYQIAEQMTSVYEEIDDRPKDDFISRNFNINRTKKKGGLVEW